MPEVSQPLYARLRDALRAQILDRVLAPGDQLPSEAELSAVHGVSRITVRQALGDLQKAGLIVRQQGRGAFVAPRHAMQDLQRLQGLSEAMAGQGQPVRSKRLSTREVRATGALAAQLGVAPGTMVVQLASLRYLGGEPFSVSRSHFVPGLGQRVARIDVSDRDLLEVIERDLAQPVREARLEIGAMAMPAREAKWLRCEPGEPALRVHRLVLGADGQPLHAEDSIHRADRFSLRLVLQR